MTVMTQAQIEECNEAYHKIVASRILIMNCSKNYVQSYLSNAYLTNNYKYPNTKASTLITSIKPKNTNEKIKAVVNIHAVENEHADNNINTT